TYVHDAVAPAAPSGLIVTPASSRSSIEPTVTGTAEPGSIVRLYTTADCSGPQAISGTAALFASPGIIVTAKPNAATTITATATDAAGNVSPCSDGVVFVHDDITPPAPTGLLTIPTSPSRTNTNPTVVGTAEAGSTVRLYNTADCSGAPVATGTASA